LFLSDDENSALTAITETLPAVAAADKTAVEKPCDLMSSSETSDGPFMSRLMSSLRAASLFLLSSYDNATDGETLLVESDARYLT
jgi:hypothetical protein